MALTELFHPLQQVNCDSVSEAVATLGASALLQSAHRHPFTDSPLQVGVPFFEHFHKHLGDQGSIHLARVGETIVGFSMLLFGHDTVFFKFTGLDYEISPQNMTYFEIEYDTIDSAVERGLRYVDMGSGTSHVKAPLGCRQIPTTYHIQFRRFLRPFSGIMSTLLGSHFGNLFD